MTTQNKEELLDTITECNILRLKTNEAIQFIQKQTKTKISERTYRRYKKELQDKVDTRIEYMIRSELVPEIIQAIDLIKKIIREHWINYNASNSIKEKKSILDSITKAQAELISNYSASTIVQNIKNWFESELKKIQDEKKQTKNDSELLTTYAN